MHVCYITSLLNKNIIKYETFKLYDKELFFENLVEL